jgi:protease I
MLNKKSIIINLLVIILFLITGCALNKNNDQPINNMDLSNKRVLIVVSPIGFQDKEYSDTRNIIEGNRADVKVASIQGGVAKGAFGAEAQIDLTVSEADVQDFDAVVFVGGPGMAEIVGDDSLQMLAKKFYKAGKITAAICVAPAILARAGVLEGKQATSWSGAEEDLYNGGAIYTGNAVTVDGQIITANGPQAAREFGEKIVDALSGK